MGHSLSFCATGPVGNCLLELRRSCLCSTVSLRGKGSTTTVPRWTLRTRCRHHEELIIRPATSCPGLGPLARKGTDDAIFRVSDTAVAQDVAFCDSGWQGCLCVCDSATDAPLLASDLQVSYHSS